MPIAPTFKAAVHVLAELAADNHPSYVRVNAASKLAKLLSPANPHYGDILYVLNDDQPRSNRAPALSPPEEPTEHPYACYVRNSENTETPEDSEDSEEDESEDTDQEDEPP